MLSPCVRFHPLRAPASPTRPAFAVAAAVAAAAAAARCKVNDDTEMAGPWAVKMMKELAALSPPNVGAVGPLCKQGNQKIPTHDFTHRTHMEVGACCNTPSTRPPNTQNFL